MFRTALAAAVLLLSVPAIAQPAATGARVEVMGIGRRAGRVESAQHRLARCDGPNRRSLARPAGLEPATPGFGGQCSIH